MNTAATPFRRFDFGRRSTCRSFVCDYLLEALDAVSGEGRHSILTYAADPQAAVFGIHVDLEIPQPFLVLAKLFGDVFEREDV